MQDRHESQLRLRATGINRPNEGRAIRTALVAEDDMQFRRLLVSKLLDDGFEVYEASTGTDVLRLLASPDGDTMRIDHVDLLVMNQRMPGLSGIDILKTLRARHCATPCILMATSADPWVRTRASELCTTLLMRPFSLSTMRDIAQSLLASGSSDGASSWRSNRRSALP